MKYAVIGGLVIAGLLALRFLFMLWLSVGAIERRKKPRK
jgi:hypothetical protein